MGEQGKTLGVLGEADPANRQIPVKSFSHTQCGKIASAKSEKRAFHQMSEAIHQEQELRGTFRSRYLVSRWGGAFVIYRLELYAKD